jgi:hypothetical protein
MPASPDKKYIGFEMNKEHLKSFVEQNPKLVKMTASSLYPGLFVLKYTRRVFYDNLWSVELEHCRGTIVDKDFNLVSCPFQKIYNYGIEKQAPVLDPNTIVNAYRKINGFMIAVTWYNGDILVSTTGSTDSDYVKMARELIDVDRYRKVCSKWYNTTFMFECVHRNDPHIIPETEGMYLLGYRPKSWEESLTNPDPKLLRMLAVEFGTLLVEHHSTTMGSLVEEVKGVRHEGFIFYTKSGVSSKIKSPYYLVKKWVSRNPRTDKLVDMKNDIKKNIDEEYHGLIDAIRLNIVEYTAMNEQARLAWVRKFMEK